jgi:hypothetical protein
MMNAANQEEALMRLKFVAALMLAVSFSSAALAADVRWTSTKKPLEVLGMPAGEEEADDVLRLTCLKGGAVQVGLGGYKSLGQGKGEPLSATLASGSTTVTLQGKSTQSKNFEMTASYELRADLAAAEFATLASVLAAGTPIRVSGAMKDVWSVKGLKAVAQGFSAGCAKN